MDRYSSSLEDCTARLQLMAQQRTAALTEDHAARQLVSETRQLVSEELAARKALFASAPGLPPEVLPNTCTEHRSQLQHRTIDQTILYNRSLMPMCADCVYKQLAKWTPPNTDYHFGHIDTCTCASQVLANGCCVWCALEMLVEARDRCESLCFENVEELRALKCLCGNKPMLGNETLRFCPGCRDYVTVPLHGLDNATHLACLAGRRSEVFGGAEDPSLLGSPVSCQVHPVEPFEGILFDPITFPQHTPKGQNQGSGQTLLGWLLKERQKMQHQQHGPPQTQHASASNASDSSANAAIAQMRHQQTHTSPNQVSMGFRRHYYGGPSPGG